MGVRHEGWQGGSTTSQGWLLAASKPSLSSSLHFSPLLSSLSSLLPSPPLTLLPLPPCHYYNWVGGVLYATVEGTQAGERDSTVPGE